jgi:type IV pilus assembly protein PilM
MSARKNSTLFYKDKPLFGLDIGYNRVKVMQIETNKSNHEIIGYGAMPFDPALIDKGVITDPNMLAGQLSEFLKKDVTGVINAKRVVIAIPADHTFIRSVVLPVAAAKDLDNAIRLEVEQYIPMPVSEMNIDYNVIRQTDKEVQILVVAVSKVVAESYVAVGEAMGLEVVALEPSFTAVTRLFSQLDKADLPTVLIDIGAISSDVIVYDGGVITAGTVPGGGDTLTDDVSKKLRISTEESVFIKVKYGVGPGYKQKDVRAAAAAQLKQIVQEVERIKRYYEEHLEGKTIGQVIITGGGSNLLGINDYLTEALRAPARSFIPWQKLTFRNINPPPDIDNMIYVTVGGLAMLTSQEIFS